MAADALELIDHATMDLLQALAALGIETAAVRIAMPPEQYRSPGVAALTSGSR
jgi:hypothetical protein